MISREDLFKIRHIQKINTDKYIKRNYKSVGIDSRNIKKGELFFAIKGERTDGHKYLDSVFDKGIELAVVNDTWFIKNKKKFPGKSFLTVRDTTKALGELALHHKANFKIPVLCIAGSNGKTTTKDLTAEVLSQKFKVLKTEGNFNNHIGLPLTLLRLDRTHEICVLEAGCNHYGELKYLCEIAEPDYGMITNIGKEHLEFFKNLEGVAKAEFELFDYLKSKEKGILFINSDDKFIRNYSLEVKSGKKFTYSYKYNSDVKGRFKGYNKNFEPEIRITKDDMEFKTSVATFGKHSVYNGLAAAAVGLYFNVSPAKIKSALKNFKVTSSKRMEVVRKNDLTIINDSYNSNPESVKMGLETLMEYKSKGKKFAVLSDMLELGRSGKKEHSEAGKLAQKLKVDNLYTFGNESYNTFKNAKKIKNNFYFKDKEDLIEMLKLNLGKNDIVYVKGSRGMKMEEVVTALTKN